MTAEEIIQGNKLIAEFDGYVFYLDSTLNKKKGVFRKEGKLPMLDFEFTYNSDWNMIMPICHKLYYLTENKIIEHSSDYEYWCDELDNAVTRTYTIEPVFKIVVEFIKWYKQQTPNS